MSSAERAGSALAGNAPVVGMAFTHDGEGYWIARADGSVVSLGESEWLGSLAGSGLNAPIVGVAAAR